MNKAPNKFLQIPKVLCNQFREEEILGNLKGEGATLAWNATSIK